MSDQPYWCRIPIQSVSFWLKHQCSKHLCCLGPSFAFAFWHFSEHEHTNYLNYSLTFPFLLQWQCFIFPEGFYNFYCFLYICSSSSSTWLRPLKLISRQAFCISFGLSCMCFGICAIDYEIRFVAIGAMMWPLMHTFNVVLAMFLLLLPYGTVHLGRKVCCCNMLQYCLVSSCFYYGHFCCLLLSLCFMLADILCLAKASRQYCISFVLEVFPLYVKIKAFLVILI